LIERGIAATPKSLQSTDLILAEVRKIPYFTETVKNKTKFHITIGHQTVIGYCLFFVCTSHPQVDPLGALQFNKTVLASNEKVILSIDTEKSEYGFVDEIKAPKLQNPAAKK